MSSTEQFLGSNKKLETSSKKRRINEDKDILEVEAEKIVVKQEKIECKKKGIKDYFSSTNKILSNTTHHADKIEVESAKEAIPLSSGSTTIINETNVLHKNETKGKKNLVDDIGTWEEPLSDFLNSNKMDGINEFVETAYSRDVCYPPKNLIFNAFRKTPWDNVKVVIIGQDPYFNKGEAMGLCFSVNKGIKTPPSLRNIYKALIEEKLMKTMPTHGDLSKWADQGVLMLNATLTVKAGQANSHQKASKWENFTDHVIKTIDTKKKGVVFLLWGAFAHKKESLLKSGNSFVVKNIHPSPLAASKGNFSGIKQFTIVNEYLSKSGLTKIDWNIL